MAPGDDQVRKIKNETNARRTKFGRPPDEGESMASDWKADTRSRRNHEGEWRHRKKQRTKEVARVMRDRGSRAS